MVMGELSSYSFFDLFQRELRVELSLIQHALEELGKDPTDLEQQQMVLLSVSAIFGASRLLDLSEVEKLARTTAKFLRNILYKQVDLTEKHLHLLKDFLRVLHPFCQKQGCLLSDLQNEKISTLKDLIQSIEQATPSVEESPSEKENKETSDEWMWTLFCEELRNQARDLEKSLMLLEGDRENQGVIDDCMRMIHSIKGASRVVQAKETVSLAHACEECFVLYRDRKQKISQDFLDLCFHLVDLLLHLSKQIEADMGEWRCSREGQMKALESAFGKISRGEKVPKEQQLVCGFSSQSPAQDSVLMVSSSHIDEMVALSGEAYVSNHKITSFIKSVMQLKALQSKLSSAQKNAIEQVRNTGEGEPALEWMEKAQQVNQEFQESLNICLDEMENFSHLSLNLGERLYRKSLCCRMRPFSEGIRQLPRLVRDLGKTQNKKVSLKCCGERTQVDREVLLKLKPVLSHLISNAVDHGIEGASERKALGKNEEGTVWLEARQKGVDLIVEVADDGRGLDLESLKEKVVQRGECVTEFNEKEIIDFAFLSGLSTKEGSSDVSGRGVGLSSVKETVEEIGGFVYLSSTKGKGVTVTLQLPLTQSVLRSIVIEASEEVYAFPLAGIERVSMVRHRDLKEEGKFLELEGKKYRVQKLSELLALPESKKQEKSAEKILSLVLVQGKREAFAWIVDAVLGEKELLLRPLDPLINHVRAVSAASILEDGSPVLIVDVQELLFDER